MAHVVKNAILQEVLGKIVLFIRVIRVIRGEKRGSYANQEFVQKGYFSLHQRCG